jgi:hypothetical protein
MNSILEIKFRLAVFGLKSVRDSKDAAIFEAVIKTPEFEESMKTFERICEETCKDKRLKREFHSAIDGARESHGAKEVADLFRECKFEKAVTALEEIYLAIYGKPEEYDSEYQHFLDEIKRIADSQLKERKPGSIRMWTKIVAGASIAAVVTAAYVKKRNKGKKKQGEKTSDPG